MKNPGIKILIIDDEVQIRRFIRVSLEANNYEVIEASSGQVGIDLSTIEKPNLILLDLGLPDMDGLDVLKIIRSWSLVPVIVISARDAVDDIVNLLDNGANDYLTKPFSTPELIARMRAALRQSILAEGKNSVMHFKQLTINFSQRAVYVNDIYQKLTKKEYEIISLLAKNAGKVITQKHLLSAVWGDIYQENIEYLRTYIAQLRKKIETDYKNPEIILTETGVGYRFIEPNSVK